MCLEELLTAIDIISYGEVQYVRCVTHTRMSRGNCPNFYVTLSRTQAGLKCRFPAPTGSAPALWKSIFGREVPPGNCVRRSIRQGFPQILSASSFA